MADHDGPDTGRWIELQQLAREAEESARPMPVARVRRLGERRRARRQIGLAVAAALTVVVAGGALVNQSALRVDPVPNPAGTPTVVTASPSPARTVTATNLITGAQVPTTEQERYAETPAGVGRQIERISVCLPDAGIDPLGPTAVITRNFRLDRRALGETNTPEPPFNGDPTIYTAALQFGSAADAQQAYADLRAEIDRCGDTISARKDTSIRSAAQWYDVRTDRPDAQAAFSDVIWRESSDLSESGYFESVGVALLGDRMAITVSLEYGMDYNVAYDQDGDPNLDLPPHPQYTLLVAAVDRLAD